jgi:hypothetical protein
LEMGHVQVGGHSGAETALREAAQALIAEAMQVMPAFETSASEGDRHAPVEARAARAR